MDIANEMLITVGTSVAGAIFGFVKAFRFVQEGERGIKLQFGRAKRNSKGEPIIIEPGFVLLIPFVQSLRRHHIRQQSHRFPDQRITLKDGLIYLVGGMVIFKVVDVYKAMFDINDIDHSINDLCMAAIRDELQQLVHEELNDLDDISAKLLARVKQRASEWGIEIIQFSLPECAPTPETANLLNAALGVELRLRALDSGLKSYNLSLQTVSPNLAAVLVGIPLTATLGSHREASNILDQAKPKSESEHKSFAFSVDSEKNQEN